MQLRQGTTCQAGCALGTASDWCARVCYYCKRCCRLASPVTYSICPAGFYRSAGHYFTFYLICICSMLQMSAVYRLMAAASPNMDIASAAGEMQLSHSCSLSFHQTLFAAYC